MSESVKYVHFGDASGLIEGLVNSRRTVFITDGNVLESWGAFFEGKEVLVMGNGESNKGLKEYERLCCELLKIGADRNVLLVGVGGGIVSDMVGFIGATFMRGMNFGFVPTTLLGQIDASIGGKNGVNLAGYKNMLGTFSEPEFVIIDCSFLTTLPSRERSAAWGEVIKYELLMGEELFDDISSIKKCVEFKLGIVQADLTDKGVRHILNLGHTFAHALEKLSNGVIKHGEAVGIGLILMGRMSVWMGLLDNAVALNIERRVAKCNLPTLLPSGISGDCLVDVMCGDKKRVGDVLRMVLFEGERGAVVRDVTGEMLRDFLRCF